MLAAGLPHVATLGGTVLPLAGRARVYACGITRARPVTHLGHAAGRTPHPPPATTSPTTEPMVSATSNR